MNADTISEVMVHSFKIELFGGISLLCKWLTLSCFMFECVFLSVAKRSRNTWNGGGWGICPQVLLKNGFLINCSLFRNVKVCCYN